MLLWGRLGAHLEPAGTVPPVAYETPYGEADVLLDPHFNVPHFQIIVGGAECDTPRGGLVFVVVVGCCLRVGFCETVTCDSNDVWPSQ